MIILRRFGVWVISSKAKARNSIRVKISMMVVFFSVFIIAASWLLCSYVLSGVFRYSIKNNLIATYDSCNELFRNATGEEFDNGDLFGQIKNPQDAVVMIVDSENGKLYTSINDEGQMMEGMRSLMSSIQNEDSESQFEKGEYIIRRNHDTVTNADYYDLIGRLENGYEVLLRTPIARVESVMKVMTHLFVYICIGLMVFGTAFMLLFSNIFAAPIKRMSKAAKRMSELDFDVKIPVTSNDEIGELGNSMNEMSEKLEHTISELKAANIELQRDIAERRKIDDMRKEFLSHVSHELKTPIASMKVLADSLLSQEGMPEEIYREFLGDITNEIERMTKIINDLLSMVKMDKNTSQVEVVNTSINDLLEQLLKRLRPIAAERNIELIYESYRPVMADIDETKMSIALNNLIENAIKYNYDDGWVRVTLNADHKFFYVTVQDSGVGIPEDVQDNVFERFYRVDKARSRDTGGTGLGLSLTRSAVLLHRGSIKLYSKEKEGTTFTVRIPLTYVP